MLICSMGVSVDGYTADRDGDFGFGAPDDEQFRFQLEQIRELGAYLCGRHLYEAMVVWETVPAMRETELGAEFADAWASIPKVVFSRTLTSVQGNARLAEASLADEIAAATASTDRYISIGGPNLIAQAVALDLLDEARMFRRPVVLGGGTQLLPADDGWLPLELLETRRFEGRTGVTYSSSGSPESNAPVVYERYRLVRETAS